MFNIPIPLPEYKLEAKEIIVGVAAYAAVLVVFVGATINTTN